MTSQEGQGHIRKNILWSKYKSYFWKHYKNTNKLLWCPITQPQMYLEGDFSNGWPSLKVKVTGIRHFMSSLPTFIWSIKYFLTLLTLCLYFEGLTLFDLPKVKVMQSPIKYQMFISLSVFYKAHMVELVQVLRHYILYKMVILIGGDHLFNFNGFFKHIFTKVGPELETSYVNILKNAKTWKMPLGLNLHGILMCPQP